MPQVMDVKLSNITKETEENNFVNIIDPLMKRLYILIILLF